MSFHRGKRSPMSKTTDLQPSRGPAFVRRGLSPRARTANLVLPRKVRGTFMQALESYSTFSREEDSGRVEELLSANDEASSFSLVEVPQKTSYLLK